MKSYPTVDEILAALGDKVVAALGTSAQLARADLLDYRRHRPAWVAAHSERGLANWLHDRQWDHLVALLADVAGISVVDKEPIRDVYVGIRYRMRIKRHQWDGRVSTYPTQAALDFMIQPSTLDGLDEVHLIGGYYWDKELRDVTGAVLSLRDGVDHQIWAIELPFPGEQPPGTTGVPVSPTPVPPVIDTGSLGKKEEKEST
jgi:hypothetical protein